MGEGPGVRSGFGEAFVVWSKTGVKGAKAHKKSGVFAGMGE